MTRRAPGAAEPSAEARVWTERLGLERHPEGGWYRQIYRADETLPATALPPRYGGARASATVIHYLLEHPDVSRLHRLASDEIWHFHAGSPLRVVTFGDDGERRDFDLGPDPSAGERFVAVVPRGRWFGAYLPRGGWALVSCTVTPGFEFDDFELAHRGALLERWPQHCKVVERLTAP